MNLIELNANMRTATGNGPARVLRREGRVPAILYGPGTEPVMLSFDAGDFEKAIKNRKISQILLSLVIQNGEKTARTAMVKSVQAHPVSRNLLHIDFYEVSMDRKVKVKVPIVAMGKSIGVELGGMLQIVRREVEVLCFPNEIPEQIELDVTEMNTGDSIHVRDIELEGDMEIPSEVNYTILTVLAPKGEAEEELEEGDEEEETEAEAGTETEES